MEELSNNIVLDIKDLTKSFGGLEAVSHVSFGVNQGELSAIIGPNGAGKTTLFNLITGFIPADSGSVSLYGKNIEGLSVDEITKRGVGKSFQRVAIFPAMTVFENMQIATMAHLGKSLNPFTMANSLSDVNDEIHETLEMIGLWDIRDSSAGTLSHGDKKLLDIGMGLVLEPKVVLLDEPTAGMSPDERFAAMDLIKDLQAKMNLTIVFIEHDMDIVFGAAKLIRVMNQGKVIATGLPKEIKDNKEVIQAYLGRTVV